MSWSKDPGAFQVELLGTLREELAEWEEFAPVSNNATPYILATPDCGLGLRVYNTEIRPVRVRPHYLEGILAGPSSMTLHYARSLETRVRHNGYQIIPISEVPARRMKVLRELIAALTQENA